MVLGFTVEWGVSLRESRAPEEVVVLQQKLVKSHLPASLSAAAVNSLLEAVFLFVTTTMVASSGIKADPLLLLW